MKLVRFMSGANEYLFAQVPFSAHEFDVDVNEKLNATTVSYFNPEIVMESVSGKYTVFADNTYITQHDIEQIIPNKKGRYANYNGDEGETVDNHKVAMQLLLVYLNLKNKVWILKRAF